MGPDALDSKVQGGHPTVQERAGVCKCPLVPAGPCWPFQRAPSSEDQCPPREASVFPDAGDKVGSVRRAEGPSHTAHGHTAEPAYYRGVTTKEKTRLYLARPGCYEHRDVCEHRDGLQPGERLRGDINTLKAE